MRYELLDNYYKGEEYTRKLKRRIEILSEMRDNPERHAYWCWQFANTGADGVILFLEVCASIKIPEYNNQIKPFFLFDYQKRVINKISEDEADNQDHDILIDKPRGMGITWIIVWMQIHHWLFNKEWTGFDLSRTESEVDDGTALPDGSIFGKTRWALARLPSWIKPIGFLPKLKKGTSTDSNLKLINPDINSSLTGSSTNANAGRSRRYSWTFVDEAFFVENFQMVYAALQSVSRIKIFVSTVIPGTRFKKFKDLAESRGDYISLTWRDHPFKDQQWYNEQLPKAEFNEDIMREIEPSYVVSKSQQYYPEIMQAKLEQLVYNANLPLYASIDIGKGDMTVIIFYQFDGETIYVISAYGNKQKALPWYMPFFAWWTFGEFAQPASAMRDQVLAIEDMVEGRKYNEFQRRFISHMMAWKKPIAYFGEVAHRQRVMPLNKSVADYLQAAPYRIRLLVNTKGVEFKPRRLATQALLPRTVFNNDPGEPYVTELYDALMNSRYAKALNATSADAGEKPVHDPEVADYRAAFENFSVNFARIIRHKAKSDPGYREKARGSNFVRGILGLLKQ